MAALAVEISLDELRKFVPKFQRATTLEIGNELKRQARLLVRSDSGSGLVAVTPPPEGSKLGDGKSVGEAAVERDINKIFLTVALARAILKRSGQRGAKLAFDRYMRPGDPQYSEARALAFLNGQVSTTVQVDAYTTKSGKRVSGYTQTRQAPQFGHPRLGQLSYVADAPSQQIHRANRDSRGKVKTPYWSQLVVKKGKMTSYIEKNKRRVGLLKAGWAKAAQQAALGVELPEFVTRNMSAAKGRGIPSFGNPLNMSITLINQSANAATVINKGAINFVMRLRQDNILREFEHRLGKLAKAA